MSAPSEKKEGSSFKGDVIKYFMSKGGRSFEGGALSSIGALLSKCGKLSLHLLNFSVLTYFNSQFKYTLCLVLALSLLLRS